MWDAIIRILYIFYESIKLLFYKKKLIPFLVRLGPQYLVRLIKFCVQTSILFEQANVLSLINLLTNTYADMTLVSMVGGVLCVHAREPIELYNTDFITVV